MLSWIINLFRFAGAILRGLRDPEFRGLLLFVLGILISGTVFYHLIEGWRWLDSFYFSVTTLSTVGFGDMSPHTDAGKMFTVLYIFFGVGVILGFINVVAKHTQEQGENILLNKKRR